MNLNIPAVANLLGANPLMSPEQAQNIRSLLHQEEHVLASLNAEIQQASALLEKLTRDRDALQEVMVGRSPTQSAALRSVIEEMECEFNRLQNESNEAKDHLAYLYRERELDPTRTDLVHQIRCTGIVLKTLSGKMDELQASLDVKRNILSPIRRIPIEILSEIFRWCMPDDDFVVVKIKQAPLLLTTVCSSWRKLACASPYLWSSISVTITRDKCSPAPRLIDLWLHRTMEQPISFSIVEQLQLEDLTTSDEYILSCRDILPYFADHCHRWERVKLEYTDWRMSSGLVAISRKSPLSSLRSLDLHREYWVSAETNELSHIVTAPALRDFTWYSRSAPIKPLSLIPASQLTRLHIVRPVTMDDYFDIISRYPLLQSAAIYVQLVGREPDDPIVIPDTPIHLPDLKEFSLTVDTSITSLFSRITAPSLTTLRINRLDEYLLIDPQEGVTFWNQDEVTAFLQRSKCALETFELRDGELSAEELVPLLTASSPSLKNLMISNERSSLCSVTDVAIEALMPVDEKCLCPRLELLKLWRCISSTDGMLSDMIAARWGSRQEKRPLRLVIVLLNDESRHPMDVERLKVLHTQRAGITLVRR
ncbi:hypothetical protein CPB85DRAFT_1019051 [Mucidula mucida]|nr:hypothetical protein CPB85DRAFT_1019051 [Mucidula mucida]